VAVVAASSGPTVALIPPGAWKVDPNHSSVNFHVKHVAVATVKGRFTAFEGTIEAGEDGGLQAHGTVDVASIDTHESKRDAHLRSPELFDAATHPQITFASTYITPPAEPVWGSSVVSRSRAGPGRWC